MNRTLRIAVGTIVVLLFTLITPVAAHAQVRVIISGGFSGAYTRLLPEFERTSGVTVTTTRGGSQGTGPNTITAQLARGVPVDVVIMNRAGLNDLIKEGRIVAGTDVDLAQTSLALAVRAGVAKPDIRTVEAFKQTLLHASSVTMDSSTTGIFLTTTLFPRLGIGEQMTPKVKMSGASAVASGEAEIGVQPLSELLPVKGIDIVGMLPDDVQYTAVFSAAIVSSSQQPDLGRRLIAFLTSEDAKPAIRESGMELSKPAKR